MEKSGMLQLVDIKNAKTKFISTIHQYFSLHIITFLLPLYFLSPHRKSRSFLH